VYLHILLIFRLR